MAALIVPSTHTADIQYLEACVQQLQVTQAFIIQIKAELDQQIINVRKLEDVVAELLANADENKAQLAKYQSEIATLKARIEKQKSAVYDHQDPDALEAQLLRDSILRRERANQSLSHTVIRLDCDANLLRKELDFERLKGEKFLKENIELKQALMKQIAYQAIYGGGIA